MSRGGSMSAIFVSLFCWRRKKKGGVGRICMCVWNVWTHGAEKCHGRNIFLKHVRENTFWWEPFRLWYVHGNSNMDAKRCGGTQWVTESRISRFFFFWLFLSRQQPNHKTPSHENTLQENTFCTALAFADNSFFFEAKRKTNLV